MRRLPTHTVPQAREQAMERVRESLVNQRQVFMEKMAAKSRHEQWLELKRAQQRERALQLAKDALAHKWAVNSAAVNMLLSIRSLFQLCRQKLPLLKRVKYCVRVIIKTFRQYRLWKETKRIQAEVKSIPVRQRCFSGASLLRFRGTFVQESAGDSS
jgi:hypothetical protein